MARPSGKVVFLVAGGLFALIGLDLVVGSIQLYRREKGFAQALTTDGIVSVKRTENTSSTKTSRHSFTECYVTASYKIGKQWYSVEQTVSSSVYEGLKVGSPIRIFYRASDPSDGVIRKPSREWIFGVIGVPAFLVGAIAFVIGLRGDAP